MNFNSNLVSVFRGCNRNKQLRAVLHHTVTQEAGCKVLWWCTGRGDRLCLPRSCVAVAEILTLCSTYELKRVRKEGQGWMKGLKEGREEGKKFHTSQT